MVKQITYYKNKSLLDLPPKIVICHQVNCQGVMGAGLAKQIHIRWPEVYVDYKKTIENAEAQVAGLENPPDDILLGAVACTTTIDGHRVASLFAQYDYGYGPRRYTNYEAFANCLENLNKLVPGYIPIAFPYKIGCGLGGGDWDIIQLMIRKILHHEDVYICQLED